MPSSATLSRAHQPIGEHSWVEAITISWTADAAGAFADLSLGSLVIGKLERIVTVPGTPAPTALYDITLVDEDGIDVLGGGGIDRSATAAQEAACPLGTYFLRDLANALTLKIANNAVANAQGKIVLYLFQ